MTGLELLIAGLVIGALVGHGLTDDYYQQREKADRIRRWPR